MPAEVELLLNLVAIFWLLPLVLVAVRSLHLKKLRHGPKVWIASILHEDPDLLWVTDKQMRLEIIYQNLQLELIQTRQSVAKDIQGSHVFQKKIDKLTHERKQMEKRIRTERNLQNGEERLQAILSELQQVENSFDLYKQYIDRRREALTAIEDQVQRAYTRKQILIAQMRSEAAVDKAFKMLSHVDPNFMHVTIERIEKKVSRSETEIYGSSFFDDACFNFPALARSLETRALDTFDLNELKKLLVKLELAAEENDRVVQRGIAYEHALLSNAEELEDEARDLERRTHGFGDFQYADRKRAESRLYTCWDMSHRLRKYVECSKLCTSELIKMHTNFAKKEREILDRIAELERLEAKNSDNLGGDSDPGFNR